MHPPPLASQQIQVWWGFFLFLFIAAILLRRITSNKPVCVLTEDGVSTDRYKSLVPWSEIKGVRTFTSKKENEKKYLEKTVETKVGI